MKYLLIIPPLTQLNTPYPSTAVLKGFLEANGQLVAQVDLGIELVDRIYRRSTLEHFAASIADDEARKQLLQRACCVDAVMRFLRGTDNTLAPRIANRSLLPEGSRFGQLTDLEWAFGTAGVDDRARYLATIYVEEIADLLREHVDAHFDLVRYAEQISTYAATFDELQQALASPASPIDVMMLQLLEEHILAEKPDIVGFSIPFPGCLYGALRCCQWLRQQPHVPVIALGGGFINTELRSMQDRRIYDYCHHILFDDGLLPLLQLSNLQSTQSAADPRHTLNSQHSTLNSATPSFAGLPLHKYLSLIEMANPMHRLWSQGRWIKLMMAHGCYWHRCAFCDTSLDYIGRYEAPSATTVVDRMEQLMQQTGVSGFHFVDEALPPRLLEEVCHEILRRRLSLSFWGNIRFEKAYTQELCDLLADAGCVAVSGGLEVASDRLLKLMDKGVTVQQTIQACRHFRNAGIMVHTYLMYGFPTETLQESLDALDNVRRMFDEGIIQSAFWHRYAMTCHSPSGLHPEAFGARCTTLTPNPFCNNEVDWLPLNSNPSTINPQFPYDIEELGRGLRLATYNYMNGLGLDQPLRTWFPALKLPHVKPSPSKSHHSR